MTRGPVMAYLIGGPYDLTKRLLTHKLDELVFIEPPAPILADIPHEAFGAPLLPLTYRYVPMVDLPKTLWDADMPVVVYTYWRPSR